MRTVSQILRTRARFAAAGLVRAASGFYMCRCKSSCGGKGGIEIREATLDAHRVRDWEQFGECLPVPERVRKRSHKARAAEAGVAAGAVEAEADETSTEQVGEDQLEEGRESTSPHAPSSTSVGPSRSGQRPEARPAKRARLSATPAAIPTAGPSPSPTTPTALSTERQRQVDALIAHLAAEQAAEDEVNAEVERQKAERRSQFSKLFKAARKDAKRLANVDDIEAGWAKFCAAQRDREKEAARLMGEEGDDGQPEPEVDGSGQGSNGQEGDGLRVVKEEPRGE